MQYIKVVLQAEDPDSRELLVAGLTEIGFEGFEETDTELMAYVPESIFNEEELRLVLGDGPVYSLEIIPEQNWNAVWEENFQPVVVDGFCTVRAHFHTMPVKTPYEIVITPKMSFGTGHHATTQLMMQQMRGMDMSGYEVLDFGTGTGILAILAEMLGAGSVLATDNDPWCFENAVENVTGNNCRNIQVKLASGIDEDLISFDIVLANINRNILLENMDIMKSKLKDNGMILMSGLLKEDEEIITSAAATRGLHKLKIAEQDNWIAILFACNPVI